MDNIPTERLAGGEASDLWISVTKKWLAAPQSKTVGHSTLQIRGMGEGAFLKALSIYSKVMGRRARKYLNTICKKFQP